MSQKSIVNNLHQSTAFLINGVNLSASWKQLYSESHTATSPADWGHSGEENSNPCRCLLSSRALVEEAGRLSSLPLGRPYGAAVNVGKAEGKKDG